MGPLEDGALVDADALGAFEETGWELLLGALVLLISVPDALLLELLLGTFVLLMLVSFADFTLWKVEVLL